MMRALCLTLLLLVALPVLSSERTVTYTVMALSGLAGDTPRYVTVYCHNNGYSSAATGFNFIGAPYFPPTNAEDAKDDHNLISASKIKVDGRFEKSGILISIDASELVISETHYGGERKGGLVEICLECVRLLIQKNRIDDFKLTIKAPAGLEDEIEAMRQKFLDSDLTKPFSHHPGDDGFGVNEE